MIFDRCIELCNYHHNQDTFQFSFQKTSFFCPFAVIQSSALKPHSSVLYPYSSAFSRMLYKWNYTVYVATWVWLLSFKYHFYSHLFCVSIVHSFSLLSHIPLYGCITTYPFANWRIALFPVLVILNKAAMNCHMYIFV